MKKKILAIAMTVCLAVIAVTGFSLAYFTDTDEATNTMVAGNVKIAQYETDRDGEDFKQNQTLIPAVYYKWVETDVEGEEVLTPYNGEAPETDAIAENYDVAIWDESVRNVIDKFVTVENKGSEAAYVRTIFLIDEKIEKVDSVLKKDVVIPDDVDFLDIIGNKEYFDTKYEGAGDAIKYNWNTDGITYDEVAYVEINDQEYKVVVATYDAALAAKEVSAPSLCQFYLDPTTGNDWYDRMGSDEFNIHVLSQAVQAQGFDAADVALDLAFGEVTEDNLATWFKLN